MNDDMAVYFSGQKLYGDDFTSDQIEEWFRDEEEDYASLGAGNRESYRYAYHKLNYLHGFRFLGKRHFRRALGIGAANGDEFKPIAASIDHITILDSSDAYSAVKDISGTPCNYRKPTSDGTMPFEDNAFDLMTCLGVMPHIPNVSYVMKECYRCLDHGGVMLLRESIHSMGDWRRPRPGLTKRERGIPYAILNDIVGAAGFKVRERAFCVFPAIPKFASKAGIATYNNTFLTLCDAALCRLFSWNTRYHRTEIHQKFGPAAAYFVLEK